MRLHPVPDVDTRDALLDGDLGDLEAAPGWPHEDTKPGMSFLDTGGLVFLVIDDDGRVAGECGTKGPPNRDGVVEIGYGLAGPSRHRGLGTAAVRTLVDRLAADPAVRGIEAEIHLSNTPSQRIVDSLGFVRSQEARNGYERFLLDVRAGHANASA